MSRARVRTTHATPERAAIVAGAVVPDNTDSMTTRVEADAVETTIERETTGGLHSTVDDYVVNLTVATRLAEETDDSMTIGTDNADEPTDDQTDDTPNTDTYE